MSEVATADTSPLASTAVPPRTFRFDIGFLRAVAVTTVVLFHFDVPFFGGGFVGVDVFFVISGFLMTQIIVGRLDRGTFTFMSFYAARIRRICPALAVLCLAVVILNVAFVDPMTAAKTGANALYSLLFVSNVSYALQESYFASSSDANWLLHTWTLSVEWQFYILYPVILVVAAKTPAIWRRRTLVAIVSCVVLFVIAVVASSFTNQTYQFGFFLLPTRAWELLAGGCVALLPARTLGRTAAAPVQAIGFALVLAATVGFDSYTPWPSWQTAAPVVGAVLVILANRNEGAVIPARAPQLLGLWSYSIYLWHWPIIVGLHYFHAEELSAGVIVGGLAFTVLAGFVSYELFEKRLANALFSERPGGSGRWLVFAAGFAALMAVSGVVWRSGGLDAVRTERLDPDARAALIDYQRAQSDYLGPAPCERRQRIALVGSVCEVGVAGATDVAVIGDSHVQQILPRAKGVVGGPDGPAGVTYLIRNGCPPLPGFTLSASGMRCAEFAEAAYDYVQRKQFKKVVILSAWKVYFLDNDGRYLYGSFCTRRDDGSCATTKDDKSLLAAAQAAFDGLEKTIARLERAGIEVRVVGPAPALWGDTASLLYRRTFLTGAAALPQPVSLAEDDARTGFIKRMLMKAAKDGGAAFVDPAPLLCPGGSCPVVIDGKFIYRDGHHLRASVVTGPRYAYLDEMLR